MDSALDTPLPSMGESFDHRTWACCVHSPIKLPTARRRLGSLVWDMLAYQQHIGFHDAPVSKYGAWMFHNAQSTWFVLEKIQPATPTWTILCPHQAQNVGTLLRQLLKPSPLRCCSGDRSNTNHPRPQTRFVLR